mgnify:CR=1 FL=1
MSLSLSGDVRQALNERAAREGHRYPLAFAASRNVMPVWLLRILTRRFSDVVRGIDQLIWALIWVGIVGLGPMAGVLALAISDLGTFIKIFSEAIETADRKPIEGVTASGANGAQAVRFGIVPQVLPVIAGLHDVDAGAIGAGAVRPGQLAVMAGTWSINEVISDRPVTGDSWFCRAFVEHDTWMNMSISPASSANLEWFVTTLCAAEMDAARRAGLNPYGFIDREVGEIGLDDPVTFLPFLYGNPMGIDASASVSGLRAWHKRGHLLRGIYEGIAFNHRIHCDPLIEAFAVEDIRVVGGVTQSDIWPQLFADTMGKPIQIPVGGEGGALGVAMVAAVGIGRFATLTEASEAMGTTTTTVEPTADGTKLM